MILNKFALCINFVVFTIVASYAQTKSDGFFLDAHFAYNSVGNGFDDETIAIAANDTFAIPDLSPGIGYGLAAGFRQGEWYTELAFQRTEHDLAWVGIKGDAVHSMWSINVRRLFFEKSRLQPFVQLGWIPLMPIRVNEGALLVSEEISSDAIFLGSIANFNGGGGIEFAMSQKISIRLSALYKRARYVSVESSEEKVALKLDEELNADDMNMTLGFILVL